MTQALIFDYLKDIKGLDHFGDELVDDIIYLNS